jgi:hypothetical protein
MRKVMTAPSSKNWNPGRTMTSAKPEPQSHEMEKRERASLYEKVANDPREAKEDSTSNRGGSAKS